MRYGFAKEVETAPLSRSASARTAPFRQILEGEELLAGLREGERPTTSCNSPRAGEKLANERFGKKKTQEKGGKLSSQQRGSGDPFPFSSSVRKEKEPIPPLAKKGRRGTTLGTSGKGPGFGDQALGGRTWNREKGIPGGSLRRKGGGKKERSGGRTVLESRSTKEKNKKVELLRVAHRAGQKEGTEPVVQVHHLRRGRGGKYPSDGIGQRNLDGQEVAEKPVPTC